MLGIPAELDLARLQTGTADITIRYDRHKEKNPTQDSPARTVTRIAALSVCQQSIDQSINQLTHSIQSYRFHPSTYIGYIQTTTARDYRQGSAGLALSRFDLLPTTRTNQPDTPAHQLTTNTASIEQLPSAVDLFSSASVKSSSG